MQYFFFEKYLMQPDSFVYINAILMLISSALFIKDLGPFYISVSQSHDVTYILFWTGRPLDKETLGGIKIESNLYG